MKGRKGAAVNVVKLFRSKSLINFAQKSKMRPSEILTKLKNETSALNARLYVTRIRRNLVAVFQTTQQCY